MMDAIIFEGGTSVSIFQQYEQWLKSLGTYINIEATSLTCNPNLGDNGWYTLIVTYKRS